LIYRFMIIDAICAPIFALTGKGAIKLGMH
jgi:hypothetical protein